jgi:hypothetical protein
MKLRAKLRPSLDGPQDVGHNHCCGMCSRLVGVSCIHVFFCTIGDSLVDLGAWARRSRGLCLFT